MTTMQSAPASTYQGGFSDPVFDAQAVFRQIMNAMARPGTIATFAPLTSPPAPLLAAMGSIAATLFDHDTTIWLEPSLRANKDVVNWLTFHTSAPLTTQAFDADFAIVANAKALPSFENHAQGTQEYPDRSTTILLQIESLLGGPPLQLSGPGIKDQACITPAGLPDLFCQQWAANGLRFPRGVDLMLVAPEGVIALPRTVKIAIG